MVAKPAQAATAAPNLADAIAQATEAGDAKTKVKTIATGFLTSVKEYVHSGDKPELRATAAGWAIAMVTTPDPETGKALTVKSAASLVGLSSSGTGRFMTLARAIKTGVPIPEGYEGWESAVRTHKDGMAGLGRHIRAWRLAQKTPTPTAELAVKAIRRVVATLKRWENEGWPKGGIEAPFNALDLARTILNGEAVHPSHVLFRAKPAPEPSEGSAEDGTDEAAA